jgi:predicted nucleic acid-binding protein
MMQLVVDADVMIDVFRNVAPAIDLLATARRRGDELLSVTPVRTEILRGTSPTLQPAVEEFMRFIRWLDVDVSLADRAGEIGRQFVRSHQGISITDLLLAAAVERVGGQLLTRNVRHFPMFPGLRPAY